jgi:DNA ligase 1
MTEKYPDLVALIPKIRAPGTESFIMEGEVVAVDDQGSVKTFQTLAGRGKKSVGLSEVKVQVCLYAFDLMYLNGEVYSLFHR